MGAAASLYSLSSETCEAFEELDPCYWPTGEEPGLFSCQFDKEWHLLHLFDRNGEGIRSRTGDHS